MENGERVSPPYWGKGLDRGLVLTLPNPLLGTPLLLNLPAKCRAGRHLNYCTFYNLVFQDKSASSGHLMASLRFQQIQTSEGPVTVNTCKIQ